MRTFDVRVAVWRPKAKNLTLKTRVVEKQRRSSDPKIDFQDVCHTKTIPISDHGENTFCSGVDLGVYVIVINCCFDFPFLLSFATIANKMPRWKHRLNLVGHACFRRLGAGFRSGVSLSSAWDQSQWRLPRVTWSSPWNASSPQAGFIVMVKCSINLCIGYSCY